MLERMKIKIRRDEGRDAVAGWMGRVCRRENGEERMGDEMCDGKMGRKEDGYMCCVVLC